MLKLCVKCHSDIANHYKNCPDCGGSRFDYICEDDGSDDEDAKRECELSMRPQPIRCEKCGSTQLTSSQQSFGIGKAAVGSFLFGGIGVLAGFLGSDRVIITCLNCGHHWKLDKNQY